MKQQRSGLVLLSLSFATLGMTHTVNASELVDVSQDYKDNFQAAKVSQSSSEAAKQYLIQKAAQLNLLSDASNMAVDSVTETPIGSVVRFVQMKNGMAVDGAGIVVTLDQQNQVLTYVNDSIPVEDSKFEALSIFGLTEAQVTQIVYDNLKLTASPTNLEIKKRVFVDNGVSRNAYQVNIAAPVDQLWSWELLIDANNGKVLRSESKAYDAAMTGKVFEPNPTIRSGKAYGQIPGYEIGAATSGAFFDSMMSTVTFDNVSRRQSGKYTLVGPNVTMADFESPKNPNCDSQTPNMSYHQNNPCFTDVSVYYFIDKNLKYLNGPLGFKLHPLKYQGPLQVDAHGLSGQDNSHYDGAADRLAFGDGGVPDGQDHDVVIHELGHAIHNWVTKGNLSQKEGLSEGIGDYWASSYDRPFMKPNHPAYRWTFSYDGHNKFWPGRTNNVTLKYPAAVQGANAEVHVAGQMWASVCMDVWDAIGKAKTDKIHWTAISMLGGQSGQLDAARAFVVATRKLFPNEPQTLATVIAKFKARGFPVQ